jgi:hypothetical protein
MKIEKVKSQFSPERATRAEPGAPTFGLIILDLHGQGGMGNGSVRARMPPMERSIGALYGY